MASEYVFIFNLSVAQKTAKSGAFGLGFNYTVEVACRNAGAFKLIRSVLNLIDHKSLGVDVNLGFEPTTILLVEWLAKRLSLEAELGFVSLKLVRGDGASVAFQGQALEIAT